MVSPLLIGSFFDKINFFEPNEHFSRNLNHYWKCREQKENLDHNILELYNVLVQIRLTTSKTKRDI